MLRFEDNRMEECPVPGLSDTVLVELAKDGDHDAYAELRRRHLPMAARAARRITRNDEDTEDVVQETFLRVLLHIKTFDGRSAFSTWVTRIAVNCSLMMLRKRRGHREISMDSTDGNGYPVYQVHDPAANPEALHARNEQLHLLRKAVRRLPPLLRDATVIHLSGDMQVKEMAAIVGISHAAAKSRVYRAGAELRAKMANATRIPTSRARLARPMAN
jgi:RNA polymerase sigma-70 factor, ECF subfamily